MKTLGLYGGTYDPPGIHRRVHAKMLTERFDEVVMYPGGPRPRGEILNDTGLIHRAVMADLTLRGVPRVRVELDDLEREHQAPAWKVEERFAAEGRVTHVIPADMVSEKCRDEPWIISGWERGREMWQNSRFLILRADNDASPMPDIPPNAEVVTVPPWETAAQIRRRVFEHQPFEHMVTPEVADYINRNGLFRGVPRTESLIRVSPHPRFRLYYDERNPDSLEMATLLEPFISDDPEMVIVLGGDGTMLRAIRELWRLRLPFFGINTGHLGFLLNSRSWKPFWNKDLVVYHLPLLRVETADLQGRVREGLAFNDCWVERATGQTAWVELSVNGEVRIPRVIADGMLVSTAAGSTSYARAMGANPVPFNNPVMLVVGSNVLAPLALRPVTLPLESTVKLSTVDPVKRPILGFVDGEPHGPIASMTIRVSRIASAELAFSIDNNPIRKLLDSLLGPVN